MNSFHDAPWLTITDQTLLQQFLNRCALNSVQDRPVLVNSIATIFSHIPYENLTKIIKSGSVINTGSAMRYPDELIRDWLRWGTGGTCFSLTAAIIAVYNAMGIEAHPVLADRHYGPDTHCGLIIFEGERLLLLDPGYLLFIPTRVPQTEKIIVNTGYNQIELVPLQNGELVELYTVVRGNRKLRLVYKIKPVDPVAFARAWEQSFAWEMMTYPVLTRVASGKHQYLQGKNLSIRNEQKTERFVLSPEKQMEYITSELGIHKDIITRAFGALNHG